MAETRLNWRGEVIIDWLVDPAKSILARVNASWHARSKASSRVNRCSKPESLEKARAEYAVAEREYEEAARVRDEFVELERARLMQRSAPQRDPKGVAGE